MYTVWFFFRCSRGERAIDCWIESGGHNKNTLVESCSLMLWRLAKVKERFLVIEPAVSQGYGLTVKNDLLQLASKADAGLFTGVDTKFGLSVSLESINEMPDGEFEKGTYGDVKVKFLNGLGTEEEGYVCDYDWNSKSAAALCQTLGFESGLPTYNGQFSLNQTSKEVVTKFAMSGAHCGHSPDGGFLSCPFRMLGDGKHYLEQRSMSKWGGGGYACGSKDRAGVLCGTESFITTQLAKNSNCTGPGYTKDSIADTHELEEQAYKVSRVMNNAKHWENYLLPIPATVSLLGMAMLQSAQVPEAIELEKPEEGFKYLEHDYYQPNLLQFSYSLTDTLKISSKNMRSIHSNSDTIQNNLLKAVRNTFSDNPMEQKLLFKLNMEQVETAAKKSYQKVSEVIESFNNTQLVLSELMESMKSTEEHNVEELKDIDQDLEILHNVTDQLKEKKDDIAKQIALAETDMNQAREAFHAEAKKATDEKCTDGTLVCNSCVQRASWQTNECTKQEAVCVQHKTVSKTLLLSFTIFVVG